MACRFVQRACRFVRQCGSNVFMASEKIVTLLNLSGVLGMRQGAGLHSEVFAAGEPGDFGFKEGVQDRPLSSTS
eukprot:5105686-Amphidinium_carterae.1